MQILAQQIIAINESEIEEILAFYELFVSGIKPFITIESGTYGRNIVSPTLPLPCVIPCTDSELAIFAKKVEFLSKPRTLINRLRDKEEIYLQAYEEMPEDKTALLCIDYEAEGVRAYFEPIYY